MFFFVEDKVYDKSIYFFSNFCYNLYSRRK